MGLQERRMAAELKDNTLPARIRKIEEICGTAVPCEIDWDSFASDAPALNFLDHTACHGVNMALRTIAQDGLGREAMSADLKAVRLKNVTNPAQRRLAFSDGVLELHTPWAVGAQGMHSDAAIPVCPDDLSPPCSNPSNQPQS